MEPTEPEKRTDLDFESVDEIFDVLDCLDPSSFDDLVGLGYLYGADDGMARLADQAPEAAAQIGASVIGLGVGPRLRVYASAGIVLTLFRRLLAWLLRRFGVNYVKRWLGRYIGRKLAELGWKGILKRLGVAIGVLGVEAVLAVLINHLLDDKATPKDLKEKAQRYKRLVDSGDMTPQEAYDLLEKAILESQ